MMKKTLLLFGLTLSLNTVAAQGLWTNAKDKTLPTDFESRVNILATFHAAATLAPR